MLSFPQKHPSRWFFLPSFSFDTHSSHLSAVRHQGEAEVPTRKPQPIDRSFFPLSFWHPFLSSVFTRSPRRSRKSHKNSVVEGSFFPLSDLIPIPLIFLHSVTEAKQISVEKVLIRFVTSQIFSIEVSHLFRVLHSHSHS